MSVLRLWMGWRRPDYCADAEGWTRFVQQLERSFIPASWQLMPAFGLRVYVPTLLSGRLEQPQPDEVALLVYQDQASYESHRQRILGRSYALMHQALFDFKSPGRQSMSAWAGPDGGSAPWRRQPSAGKHFDAPGAVIHFALLRHPKGPLPSGAALASALLGLDGELAVWAQPGFTLVWLAAEQALPIGQVSEPLLDLRPGAQLEIWQAGIKNPAFSEAQGLPALQAPATLHFCQETP